MTGPIDTIREALEAQHPEDHPWQAALTEVEQQLADQRENDRLVERAWRERDDETARAVAAETALAEANDAHAEMTVERGRWQERALRDRERAEAAERRANDLLDQATLAADALDITRRRANDLTDALRTILDYASLPGDNFADEVAVAARAALDRHTQEPA